MFQRSVPFFNYQHTFLSEREGLIRLIDDVASRGAFIMQRDLVEFEPTSPEFVGARYALGVANATDGLHHRASSGGPLVRATK